MSGSIPNSENIELLVWERDSNNSDISGVHAPERTVLRVLSLGIVLLLSDSCVFEVGHRRIVAQFVHALNDPSPQCSQFSLSLLPHPVYTRSTSASQPTDGK